jgi:Fe2+ or Zn2+ uptake regulation protein
MRAPTELAEAFRAQGRKMTPQRACLFRLLHGNHTHPTAEALYAAAVVEMPSISLRTVYQTLNDLAEMGEIHALELGTGSARFDPNVGDHHHLVCEGCGAVRDVAVDTSALAPPAEGSEGFAVRAVDVVFRGRCAACAQGAAAPR